MNPETSRNYPGSSERAPRVSVSPETQQSASPEKAPNRAEQYEQNQERRSAAATAEQLAEPAYIATQPASYTTQTTTTISSHNDDDIDISKDKEWLKSVKRIIRETTDNPGARQDRIIMLGRQYRQARYGASEQEAK